MAIDTFPLIPKASISLALMAYQPHQARARTAAIRAAGLASAESVQDAAAPLERISVIVEARSAADVADRVRNAEVRQLSESFLAVDGPVDSITDLVALPQVRRVQTKKVTQPHLDLSLPDIGLLAPETGPRPVPEDGTGVLVGIVDSGFDLSHPMFRGPDGRLRVDGLLDQTLAQPRAFTTAELEQQWSRGRGPGADDEGHGTHVATIAAGSRFQGLEGVAPGARLLLVKTNFIDTPDAVSWIFAQAGDRPCVVNLSLGHHFGAHDGTDAEELLHSQLTGPGKIIVIAAGNERPDDAHIGGDFNRGQTQDVIFDLQRQSDGAAFAVLTLWYEHADQFSTSLTPSGGVVIDGPPLGQATRTTFGSTVIDIAQQVYEPSNAIQVQIATEVAAATDSDLRGWALRLTCQEATIGRLDGWFHLNGKARFRPHSLIENARTVGLAATGAGCLAVASHATKAEWQADQGNLRDNNLVAGRSSPFSSLGPTRNGRQKPDLSAPGQMITAGLAAESQIESDERFTIVAKRLLTMAGTSAAAPVVTGAVAMLLQQKPSRTLEDIRSILSRSARRDAHTGVGPWDPFYGLGKLDIAAALRNG